MEQDETQFNFDRPKHNKQRGNVDERRQNHSTSTPNNNKNIIQTIETNHSNNQYMNLSPGNTFPNGGPNHQFQIDFNKNFNNKVVNLAQNTHRGNSNSASPNFSIELRSSTSRSSTPTPNHTDNRFNSHPQRNNNLNRQDSRSPSPVLNFKPAAKNQVHKQNGTINGGGYVNEAYQKQTNDLNQSRKKLPPVPAANRNNMKNDSSEDNFKNNDDSQRVFMTNPQQNSHFPKQMNIRSLPQPNQPQMKPANSRVLLGERVKLLPLQANNINSSNENENWF